MTVSCPPPQRSRGRIRLLPVLAILAALAGCGETPRVEIPAELPLRMHDQLFAIEWALQREPSVVRGVGRVTPSIDSEARLDLCYDEDVTAEVDMNVVCTGTGELVEVQGTGESGVFSRDELDMLLDLGLAGCAELTIHQQLALA